MARYMLMILGNGQLDGATIYGPATAQALRTPLPVETPDAAPIDHGFLEYQLPGGFTGHGHRGDTIWFHSATVTIPELSLGIFVTTNTDTGPELTDQLPTRIVEHFYAPPPAPPGPGSAAKDVQAYAGTYLTNRRPFSGLEKFVAMMIGQATIGDIPDGRLLAPAPDGDHAWIPDGPPGHFRSVDGAETMSFRLGGGEPAARWYPAGGAISYDRVGPIYQQGVLGEVAALALAALRFRRQLPQTGLQTSANRIQLAAAVLWALAFLAAAAFATSIDNRARVLADWPPPALVTASAAGLAAAGLSALALVLTPFAWWGDAEEGWGAWRKLRFSATSIVFAALGFQLACWGALEPWTR
jgi:hypothetical protein